MLKETMKPTIIFTDLDGTLLNHDDYSFEAASFMLDHIKKHEIPLIITTSKTKSEVIELQSRLDLDTPFIVENGGGIIFPEKEEGEVLTLGCSYEEIRSCFKQYAGDYNLRGFGDMDVEEIMKETSLPYEQASKAKDRLFSEPFILGDDNQFTELKKRANQDGLDVVKGGRFYHLISLGQDKAVAVKKLIAIFEEEHSSTYRSIALGDSANDKRMLQSVDIPIVIPHLDGSCLACECPNLIQAPAPGAEGWNSALNEVLNA